MTLLSSSYHDWPWLPGAAQVLPDEGRVVSCLFDDPQTPFDFKDQCDFDLHIALEVEHDRLQEMMDKGIANGIETRGISDHGFIDSIYFRDPNGYVIELTAKRPNHDHDMGSDEDAHAILDRWSTQKSRSNAKWDITERLQSVR